MYRCVKCKEEMRMEAGFRMECPNCGSKIFDKKRPSIKKIVYTK